MKTQEELERRTKLTDGSVGQSMSFDSAIAPSRNPSAGASVGVATPSASTASSCVTFFEVFMASSFASSAASWRADCQTAKRRQESVERMTYPVAGGALLNRRSRLRRHASRCAVPLGIRRQALHT